MWDLYDYQWLYQALVITTVPLGIARVWATVMLTRGRSSPHHNSVILLVIGMILGGVHMAAGHTTHRDRTADALAPAPWRSK